MFNDIGKKLKGLALTMCILGIIASIAVGVVLIIIGIEEESIIWLFGIILIIFGSIASWISSWLLYGFGELIDKTCAIELNTRPKKEKTVAHHNGEVGHTTLESEQPKVDPERITKIENLRAQGLINEEEYQKALLKAQQGATRV